MSFSSSSTNTLLPPAYSNKTPPRRFPFRRVGNNINDTTTTINGGFTTPSPSPPTKLPPPRLRAGSEDPWRRRQTQTTIRTATTPRHVRAGSILPGSSNNTNISHYEKEQQEEEDVVKMGPIRILQYDDRNHWSVLTQLYGSVWPHVLPFCIFNMVLTLLVFYHFRAYTFPKDGHQFMSLILSFLIVTRAKITYSRFMEARGSLEACYKACRELVQTACVLTQQDTSDGAVVWRHNVAYRTILLLRVTMACIEFESQHTNPWEIPEITATDQEDMTQQMLFLHNYNSKEEEEEESSNSSSSSAATSDGGDGASAQQGSSFGIPHSHQQQQQHAAALDSSSSLRDECFRAPLLLAYALRQEIMQQRSGAFLEHPFDHVNEELKMLDCVTDFLKGFSNLAKLVETPFPFPLVQMTRTFLFVWIFTLPFVLCYDANTYPVDPLIMVFLTTFGFIGIEYVSMELDDPFGDDPNDLDDLGMAQLVFEDIYISIYKLDGEDAAYTLRRKIVNRIKRGTALDNFQTDYQHGYTPQQEETIEYDRRLDFQQSGGESPFYFKKPKNKKKKKKMTSFQSLSKMSMPTKMSMPSFGSKKGGKKNKK
jgi:predicted membrane chloride channel (bestrophin family)